MLLPGAMTTREGLCSEIACVRICGAPFSDGLELSLDVLARWLMKDKGSFMALRLAAVTAPRHRGAFATIPLVAGLQAAACALLLFAVPSEGVNAQATYAPVVITPPVVDAVDENRVSVLSGKAQFTIPALKLGDVSYTVYSTNGQHFATAILDHNYGRIALCQPVYAAQGSYGGRFECSIPGNLAGIQAIHGEERATFAYVGGQYSPQGADGSTFVDNGSTCTWTKRDGTKVVFHAFHTSGNPVCQSRNIKQIITPDGRISTYHYHGSLSTTASSPILTIETNSGYLLKYNYSGTPMWGRQTSVTAINRAFETCNPATGSCTANYDDWPTVTLSRQDKMMTVSDNFPSLGSGYNGLRHYIFTIEDAAHRKHVFELDSYFRVISYQPPEATSAIYHYKLCSLLNGNALRNCFGYTTWPHNPNVFEPQPLLFDLVESVTRNGQTWSYGASFTPGGGGMSYSTWSHSVLNPLGRSMGAVGNATPGTETLYGPTERITLYDGTVVRYERSVRNVVISKETPAGILFQYAYGPLAYSRRNLRVLTQNAIPETNLSPIVQEAIYPQTCSNIVTCNKPSAVIDAKSNRTDFEYDAVHGGVRKVAAPAANGVKPQTRYTYTPRKAWYRQSNGVMTEETRPIWVLSSESFCRTTAASGSGCASPNDEVVTTYEYGPANSGPNNLLVRGKAVTADGVTLRTCYGHDEQGNVIWETAPKANLSSCTAY